MAGDEAVVRDCNILYAGVGIYTANDFLRVRDTNIYTDTGVLLDGVYGTTISGCAFSVNADAVVTNGICDTLQIVGNNIIGGNSGITLGSNAARVAIVGNWINDPSVCVHAEDANDIVVSGNVFEAAVGVYLSDCDEVAITGNQMQVSSWGVQTEVDSTEHSWLTVSGNTIRGGGVSITSYFEFNINGNTIVNAGQGVELIACFEGSVRSNDIHYPSQHGIDVDADCEKIDVVGNLVVEPGDTQANTYDGIITSADIGLILGNHIIPGASTSTRYGINIAAGSNNAVYANMLGDSSVYGTADSVDSGTSTQTSPAAGAIGGQFAY
jgi:hypothetical protein